MNYYDIIIIGSGIAGLYSALNIKQMSPDTSFMVLEKYKKKWIGGRLNNEEFYGTTVVTGAGIGRKGKDYLLVELLDKLNIKYSEFQITMNYAMPNSAQIPDSIHSIIKQLRSEYKRQKKPVTTFKHFAKSYLGERDYNHFIATLGYTDYENEDVYQTLYKYGMEDNDAGWTALNIPWRQLIQKMVHVIGSQHVRSGNNVVSIRLVNKVENKVVNKVVNKVENKVVNKVEDCFEITTEKGVVYTCGKVILATTISSIHKLLPQYKIYNHIKSQPFLRLYAKFPKQSADIMKQLVPTYTVVSGPLQKIIPMSLEKGVYMIAYSDNKSAELLKDHLKNTATNRQFFCDLLEHTLNIPNKTLKITALLDFYWPVGTHYYTPIEPSRRTEFIHAIQHPQPNMLVVGEVVAANQGWTEGALESVQCVLTKKWIESK
jgi:hypothetical protein